MKENKNNELKKDTLEQVAGGGPGYDCKDVKALMTAVGQILEEVRRMPPDDPNRSIFLETAHKLSAQLVDASIDVQQATQRKGETIKAMNESLGIN